MKIKAVFFDRDGVVNRRKFGGYIQNVNEFEFIPGFIDTFWQISKRGFSAFLVTNQQGIGKGIMSHLDLNHVHTFMQKTLLEQTGFCFEDIYYCPELASANSYYRKPNPGMILEAIDEYNIDTAASWMVGDSPTDITAGKKAGLRTIFVGKPYEDAQYAPDYVISSIKELEGIIA